MTFLLLCFMRNAGHGNKHGNRYGKRDYFENFV